jgi:RNA polymerase sigma factor (sigma-70 family)
MKVESLIKEYKQIKDKKILDQIYLSLNPVIKNKARYIFEKKYYPLSLYYRCYNCLQCKKQKSEQCQECTLCSCVKGTFNLKKRHLCSQEDIENDLWIDVLRMIETYDMSKKWDNYFYASLWNWQPTFLTKNFIKSLLDESLEESNDVEKIEESTQRIVKIEADNLIEIAKGILSEDEMKILYILLLPKKLTHLQIAKKLNVSQQTVSLKLAKIRKKLKNCL